MPPKAPASKTKPAKTLKWEVVTLSTEEFFLEHDNSGKVSVATVDPDGELDIQYSTIRELMTHLGNEKDAVNEASSDLRLARLFEAVSAARQLARKRQAENPATRDDPDDEEEDDEEDSSCDFRHPI